MSRRLAFPIWLLLALVLAACGQISPTSSPPPDTRTPLTPSPERPRPPSRQGLSFPTPLCLLSFWRR